MQLENSKVKIDTFGKISNIPNISGNFSGDSVVAGRSKFISEDLMVCLAGRVYFTQSAVVCFHFGSAPRDFNPFGLSEHVGGMGGGPPRFNHMPSDCVLANNRPLVPFAGQNGTITQSSIGRLWRCVLLHLRPSSQPGHCKKFNKLST